MNFELVQVFWVFMGVLVYLGCGMFTASFFRNSITRGTEEGRTITATVAKWGLILAWPAVLGAVCVLAALALVLIIFFIELFLSLIVSVLVFFILGIPNLIIAVVLVILSLVIIGIVAIFIGMSLWSSGNLLILVLSFPFRYWKDRQKKKKEEKEKEKGDHSDENTLS